VTLAIPPKKSRRGGPKGKHIGKNKGWTPGNDKRYQELLRVKLHDCQQFGGEDPAEDLLQRRCKNIELALLEAARHCKRADEEKTQSRKNMSAELKQLQEKRHALADREALKIVHKEIQKVLRMDLRMMCKEKIKHVLSNFNNLKSISSIRANGKRKMMTGMRNKAGEVVRERKAIADVLADFYEDLYSTRSSWYGCEGWLDNDCAAVPEVTAKEIKDNLQKMA
jgi:hypothetical protein